MHMDGSVLRGFMQNEVGDMLVTENQKRLLPELDPTLLPFSAADFTYSKYATSNSSVMLYTFQNVLTEDGAAFDSVEIVFLLSYGAGQDSMPDSDFAWYSGHFQYAAAVELADIDSAWVHAFTNISQEFTENCGNAIRVHDLDVNMAYRLGSTMIFRENDTVFRTWSNSVDYESCHETRRYLDGTYRDMAFDGNFFSNSYYVACLDQTVSLVSFATPFTQIAQQWMQRNEVAPTKGHSVIFHMENLPDHTVNGITYQVYSGGNQYEYRNQVTLLLVPKQEEQIAIVFTMDTSTDSWETLDELLVDAGKTDVVNAMLNQIELYR